MSQHKWGCNLQVQRGVHPRPPVQITHMPAQVVGKRVHGAAEVINGVDEAQERAPVRTLAGTRRVLVGIRVGVHGVAHPTGIFEFCKLQQYIYLAQLIDHLPVPHTLGSSLPQSPCHKENFRSFSSSLQPQVLDMIHLLEVRLSSRHSLSSQTRRQ